MSYQYPVPWIGLIFSTVIDIILFITVWRRFPLAWRKNNTFRRRMKWCIGWMAYNLTIAIQCNILASVLNEFTNEYQPIIGLLIIAVRETNLWIYTKKFVGNFASGDIPGAILIESYSLSLRHIILICNAMGSTATLATTAVFTGFDFVSNVYTSLKIVWLKKRHSNDTQQQVDLLQGLSLNELTEFTAPLAFMLSFVAAYYGPNYSLIGNVGATYWTFVATEDINHSLKLMSLFFIVDFCSTIISCICIVLWLFCKINLFKAFMVLEKEYRLVFGVMLSYYIPSVSNQYLTGYS